MTIHTFPQVATKSGLTRVRALPPVAEAAARRKSVSRATLPAREGCIAALAIEQELSAFDSAPRTAPVPVSATAFSQRPASSHFTAPKHHKTDAIEYRLIFMAAFAVFLFTCAFERALHPLGLSRGEDPSMRKSIIAQAKEAANISAAYAFMG